MQTGGKNPLVMRSLLGITAGVILVAIAFSQPWVPIEITSAETGVLVALAAESGKTSNAEEPIAVPIAEEPEAQTAEAPSTSTTASEDPADAVETEFE